MSLDIAAIAPGDVIAGKLRVVRRLGEGGMGCVFEVEHTFTKHRRALKLLHAHVVANRDILQRFLQEASAAGRIGNPHIAETFDAGVLDTGEPFLVMELLEGQTMADLAERHGGRLPLGLLCDLARQTVSAIGAAHEAGIVHRDLKPENLYVTRRDGRSFVKVLDFGISKFVVEGVDASTREGSMLGTPYYMSPEQFRGDKTLDARADIYSLGVLLYELAAGRRPFEAESLPALALRIAEGKQTPLETLRPELPRSFVALVARAMAADRTARFQTARELGDALAAVPVGDAVEAGPSGDQGAPGEADSVARTRPLATDAFDETAAAPAPASAPQSALSGVPAATASPASTVPGGATTAAPVLTETETREAPSSASKGPLAALVVGVGAAVILAIVLTRGGGPAAGPATGSVTSAPTAITLTPEPRASGSTETVPTLTLAAASASATPAVTSASATPEPPKGAGAASAVPAGSARAAATPATAATKKTGASRSDRHGLADDPYNK